MYFKSTRLCLSVLMVFGTLSCGKTSETNSSLAQAQSQNASIQNINYAQGYKFDGSLDLVSVTKEGKLQINGWSCIVGNINQNHVILRLQKAPFLDKYISIVANKGNETAVDDRCGTNKVGRRFGVVLPRVLSNQYSGAKIFAMGHNTKFTANVIPLNNTGKRILVAPDKVETD